MLEVEVIEEAAVAVAALDSVRAAVLAVLAEPGSATTVARQFGLPRQKVNYQDGGAQSEPMSPPRSPRGRRPTPRCIPWAGEPAGSSDDPSRCRGLRVAIWV